MTDEPTQLIPVPVWMDDDTTPPDVVDPPLKESAADPDGFLANMPIAQTVTTTQPPIVHGQRVPVVPTRQPMPAAMKGFVWGFAVASWFFVLMIVVVA